MNSKRLFVNALTFARVPLIFLWAVLAILQVHRGGLALGIAACAAMLFAGLTDAWDGSLARKWGVVSTLGKMADPLMDKVFYLVAFPTLLWMIVRREQIDGISFHGLMMLVFTVLYMLRDTWVTFMRSVGAMFGANVAAMWLGKVRTALSFPGAGWVYMYLAFSPMVPATDYGAAQLLKGWLLSCYVVEGLLMVLTLISICTYTAAYLPYLKKALAQK